MKNWLARLFGGTARPDEAVHVQPAPAPVPASATTAGTVAQAAVPDAPAPPFSLDLAFYRWLTAGVAHAGSMPEGLVLDELARLTRQPEEAADLVPRVPAVVPQLLRSLRDEAMSAGELARQVGQDVTLVAEVIREVNSPYYRATTRVTNIEGALMLLGQNGLRMLLARVAFRPVISAQTGRLARQAAPRLWSQAEKCAQAAGLAAPVLGANPFEAYLAGLMQNVGMVVALRLVDQLAGSAALPQSDSFAYALLDNARTLSARIAASWEFPPPVGAAILHAGRADAGPLAQALHEGERLAMLRVLADAGVEEAVALAASLPAAQARIYARLRSEAE